MSARRVWRGTRPAVLGLAAGHLGAAQATGDGDADALGASLHGALHGLLHGAAEGDAPLKLVGDGASDEGKRRARGCVSPGC